jgi:hypothetical protein
MIDAVQVVLMIVIVLLTILLTVLGIQVFIILRELRSTVEKVNQVLDNAQSFTEGLSQPLSFLSTFFTGTQSLSTILKLFSSKKRKDG